MKQMNITGLKRQVAQDVRHIVTEVNHMHGLMYLSDDSHHSRALHHCNRMAKAAKRMETILNGVPDVVDDEVIWIVRHDLLTQLSSVRGYIELLTMLVDEQPVTHEDAMRRCLRNARFYSERLDDNIRAEP